MIITSLSGDYVNSSLEYIRRMMHLHDVYMYNMCCFAGAGYMFQLHFLDVSNCEDWVWKIYYSDVIPCQLSVL